MRRLCPVLRCPPAGRAIDPGGVDRSRRHAAVRRSASRLPALLQALAIALALLINQVTSLGNPVLPVMFAFRHHRRRLASGLATPEVSRPPEPEQCARPSALHRQCLTRLFRLFLPAAQRPSHRKWPAIWDPCHIRSPQHALLQMTSSPGLGIESGDTFAKAALSGECFCAVSVARYS